jgi:hypothetical protein
MFRPRPDGEPATIAVVVDGRPVSVPVGASVAAAVLAAGFRSIRKTPVGGNDRGPYCMMGICFDCLAEIEGVPNRQACMVEVRSGMTVRRQIGARKVDPAS